MKIFDANQSNLTTEYNDSGHMRKVIKAQVFENWARSMEQSNNNHEDRLDAVYANITSLDIRYRELDARFSELNADVQNLHNFLLYISENYPHIAHEYTVAQKAKARMEPDDQPVTMGP